VAERYFDPAEVEGLIPTLTGIMGDAMDARKEASAVRARLAAERRRLAASGGGILDRPGWRADSQRLAALTRRVREDLGRIVELGGVPKDLELGLVDFPHLRGGMEVNLCWKHGEHEVRHWHGLDEGYKARKPL